MKPFNPTPLQSAIFNHIATQTRHLKVTARAGTGKSTTIQHALPYIKRGRSVLILSFGKDIVASMRERLANFPVNCSYDVKTFNGHGFGAILRSSRVKPELKAEKVRDIIKDSFSPRDHEMYAKYVETLVAHGKGAGIGTALLADVPASWSLLIQHFGMLLDNEDADESRAIELAQRVLQYSNDLSATIIDFNDQVYLPILKAMSFKRYDDIIVDESQDTNTIQRAILHASLKPNGRVMFFGDDAQAIYGFRGADTNAMEALAMEFPGDSLPLNVSWRCSKAVIRRAQMIVADIYAGPDAVEGTDEVWPSYHESDFCREDAILCRNSAPLIRMAYGFINRRVACRVLGREIGENLIKLIDKMDATDVDELQDLLDRWEVRECEKMMAKGRGTAVEAIHDKVDCLRCFIENLSEKDRSITALKSSINSLFSDNGAQCLTLCTVHKAKGLEWDRVFILDQQKYMPSKWALLDWQKEQEKNLIYVAYTRPKTSIISINSDCWRKEAK